MYIFQFVPEDCYDTAEPGDEVVVHYTVSTTCLHKYVMPYTYSVSKNSVSVKAQRGSFLNTNHMFNFFLRKKKPCNKHVRDLHT